MRRGAEPLSAGPRSRLWVVSELYHPERTSTGYFMTELAEGLAVSRPVSVLCSQPTYSARGQLAPVREVRNGVSIERCAGTRFDKDRLPARLVNLVTITLSLGWKVWLRVRRGDRVIVVTNPPSLPFLVLAVAGLRGAHVVLRIEDVYPEVLVAAGMARPGSMLVRVVRAATCALYRRMERVTVLGRDMAALAREKLGDRSDRLVLIANWGDVDAVRPAAREGNALLARLGIADKFVVQYMGNMGRTHGVDTLAQAALRLRERTGMHFLFVGWGGRKAALERTVAEEGLKSVTVLPGCSEGELPVYATACDLSVIAFQPGMSGVSVPSRMYNVMAGGKPILAVADPGSELARVVIEERIGWVTPPGDAAALAAAVEHAAATPRAELEAMGARARRAVESRYSKAHTVRSYEALLDELERDTAAR